MRILSLQIYNLSYFIEYPNDLHKYYVVFNADNKLARNHIYNRCINMYLIPINLRKIIQYNNLGVFNLTNTFSRKLIRRTANATSNVAYKIKDFNYELKTKRILIKKY